MNERDVVEFTCCKDDKLRIALMGRLRNLGNHLRNKRVLQAGEGTFIVSYIPRSVSSDSKNETCYLPCVYCLGYYAKATLWKHSSRCLLRKEENVINQQQARHAYQGRMLLASELHSGSQVRKLISKMKDDWITCVIKGDSLINRLGALLCLMYKSDKTSRNEFRYYLRLTAMMLVELRKLVPGVTALEEFVDPAYFNHFVLAAHNLNKNNGHNVNLSETKLSKLKWLLQKMAIMVQNDNIQSFSSEKRRKAIAFENLVLKEWKTKFMPNVSISKSAPAVTLVSICHDVKILSDYLTERIRWHSKYLQEDRGDSAHYNFLQSALLAFIILFNMKRGGVVSNMTVREFKNQHASSLWNRHCLSKLEQEVAKQLRHVEVSGRRSHVFPIFITAIMSQALELLIDCRKSVGIPNDNQNVFINSNGIQLLGYTSLKDASEECGAKRPDVIWAPELRRDVMTMAQIFNFEKKELDVLAEYLAIDVGHRNRYYRLPHEPLQVAKVSKVVSLKEKCEFDHNPSLKLDELDMNLNEEIKGRT